MTDEYTKQVKYFRNGHIRRYDIYRVFTSFRFHRDEHERHHNFNGPAIMLYYNDGSIRSEQYFLYGRRDRFDKEHPALIKYKKGNNNPSEEHWFFDDKLHARQDSDGILKPSVKKYYDDGSLKLEQFHNMNDLHHPYGPAHIEYNIDGSVKMMDFCFYGEKMDFDTWINDTHKVSNITLSINIMANFINSKYFDLCPYLTAEQKIKLKLTI